MGKLSSLRIGTLNCQGLNDKYKRMAIFDMFQNSDLSIVFLQETKLKPDCHYQYSEEWTQGESIFNSIFGGKSGTAILLKGAGMKFCNGTKMLDLEGRVIAVDLEIFGEKFHAVNSYGPIDSRDKISYLNRFTWIVVYLQFGLGIIISHNLLGLIDILSDWIMIPSPNCR